MSRFNYIYTKKRQVYNMSGWPSGLRRQTQGIDPSLTEHSGPRMRAWVRIPLLTKLFSYVYFRNVKLQSYYTKYKFYKSFKRDFFYLPLQVTIQTKYPTTANGNKNATNKPKIGP